MSLRNVLPPKIGLSTNGPACPAARDSCSLRTGTNAPTWLRTGGAGAGPGPLLGTGALGLAVLAGIWQLAAMLLNDPVFLPSVSQTAASFVHYFNRPYPAQGSLRGSTR